MTLQIKIMNSSSNESEQKQEIFTDSLLLKDLSKKTTDNSNDNQVERLKSALKFQLDIIDSLNNQLLYKIDQVNKYQQEILLMEKGFSHDKQELLSKLASIDHSDNKRGIVADETSQINSKEFSADDLKSILADKEKQYIHVAIQNSKLRKELSARAVEADLKSSEISQLKESVISCEEKCKLLEDRLSIVTNERNMFKSKVYSLSTKKRLAEISSRTIVADKAAIEQ